jgi:uncharacterized protein
MMSQINEKAQVQPATAADAADADAPVKKRGFAAMDPRDAALISSKGGRAAHAQGTAHEFTSDEAREAGRKGGRAAAAKKRAARGG